MTKHQKILTTVAWALLVVLMVGIVVSRQRQQTVADAGTSPAAQPVFTAPTFSLVDQTEKRFGSDDLKGKVWVAQFIFTNCAGPCPMMLGKMKQLQANMTDPDVHLVSFTVDPDRDTPAVLKATADQLGADHTRWHFLTGTRDEIESIAREMLTGVQTPGDEQEIPTHSDRFLLFDTHGTFRGRFDSKDEDDMQRLRAEAKSLLAQRGGQ